MNQRTTLLAGVFSAVIAYTVFSSVIYPNWIKPLVTIDQRIAHKQKKLDELNELEDKVNQARFDYKALVNRIGTFDPAKLQNHVRVQLNTLIDQHKLQGAKVTPSRVSEDRKTKIKSMMITITATGSLQSAISFLQDVAELPYLLRMGNVALYPSGSSRRRGKLKDILNIRVPLELLVLPKHRTVGSIQEKELTRPEMVVRHEGHDYSPIWLKTPFIKFIPPVPLVVSAGPDITLKKGQRKSLMPRVSGGVKPFKYEWYPSEGLSDPNNPKPKIISSVPFEREYTLTVIASDGKSAKDTVMVIVQPRDGSKLKTPRPTNNRKRRWDDRRNKKVVMTLLNWAGNERVSELMVINKRKKTTEYFGVGSDFDGGELVYVHQTGGLVRRNKEYFIYPIGNTADKELPIEKAGEYPELKLAYDVMHKQDLEQADQDEADKESKSKNTPTTITTKPIVKQPSSRPANSPATKNSATGGRNRGKSKAGTRPGGRRNTGRVTRPVPKPKGN